MKQYVVTAIVAGVVGLQVAEAGVITAPDIVPGTSSYTTGDGLATLTPYGAGLTAGTLGSSYTNQPAASGFFGVVGNGNDNNVRDVDGDPSTTADREAIDLTLDATVGLSQIAFRYARADGPAANDGIVISGFLADPGATTSSGVGITYNAGSLYLNYGWDAGTVRTFDLSNLAASAGQTLRFSANDSDQTNAQFSVNSLSYTIPEPATLGLIAAMGGSILFIRRRLIM